MFRNILSKLGSFTRNMVSIDESKVSSVNLGFWFFAILCAYCIFKTKNIPDNLMNIVITLSITHGAVYFGNIRKAAVETSSKIIDAIKSGKGVPGILNVLAGSITDTPPASTTTNPTPEATPNKDQSNNTTV